MSSFEDGAISIDIKWYKDGSRCLEFFIGWQGSILTCNASESHTRVGFLHPTKWRDE